MQTQLRVSNPVRAAAPLPSLNPVLRDLVRSLHSVLAAEPDPTLKAARAAHALRPFLGHPRLLDAAHREPDPERYRCHQLYAAPDGSFSVAALVWMPGQCTPIHDHVAWCVVGVHEGCEEEVHYRLIERPDESYLVPVGASLHPAGTVAALNPPGDIHHVINPGPDLAISVHVYGADIRASGTSIRRCYDLKVMGLIDVAVH